MSVLSHHQLRKLRLDCVLTLRAGCLANFDAIFRVLIPVAPPSHYDWRGEKYIVALSTVCFDLRYLLNLNDQTETHTQMNTFENITLPSPVRLHSTYVYANIQARLG